VAGGEIQAICPPDCITRFKLCVKRWNETAAPRPCKAKWQLDFLARWKAKKYFIYSQGAIELDGYSVLKPEGRFSGEQIRRTKTAILNQAGPNQDALRHLDQAGRSGYGDSWWVIEQIV
jgi:hypothetical protein